MVPFEERMPEVYRAADLFVCRAGAMTVAELLVAGVPAILAPRPGVATRPSDPQRRSAGRRRGRRSILVPDAECTAERLAVERAAARPPVRPGPPGRHGRGRPEGGSGMPTPRTSVAELVDAHAR